MSVYQTVQQLPSSMMDGSSPISSPPTSSTLLGHGGSSSYYCRSTSSPSSNSSQHGVNINTSTSYRQMRRGPQQQQVCGRQITSSTGVGISYAPDDAIPLGTPSATMLPLYSPLEVPAFETKLEGLNLEFKNWNELMRSAKMQLTTSTVASPSAAPLSSSDDEI